MCVIHQIKIIMKHHTIKTLATALLLTGMVAVACHKEGDATKATVQNISNTGCSYHTDKQALEEKGLFDDNDSVSYSYSHGTLSITHHNLFVNCCFEEGGIDVDITVNADTITIREYEHDGPLCDCICRTDNSFQIAHLPHGTYTLVFLSWYPEPYSITVTI